MFAAIRARRESQEARAVGISSGEIVYEDPREKKLREEAEAAKKSKKKKSTESKAAPETAASDSAERATRAAAIARVADTQDGRGEDKKLEGWGVSRRACNTSAFALITKPHSHPKH